MTLAALLVAAFLAALGGTFAARRYALRMRLLDEPGARRSHSVATPRGGGIAIAGTWLLAWCLMSMMLDTPWVLAASVAGGVALVGGIGWMDDHRHVAPRDRLAVHAVAAAWLALAVWQVGAPAWCALVALVAVLVLVNVWNFMDGIDGLAASQAAIAASAYAWLGEGPGLVAAAAVLAAAALGFLPLNAPRARIFMGDVGSGTLGYVLAVLFTLSMVESRTAPAHWPVLLLPISAFLIDSSLTLLRRMVKRERWWTPHVTHAYQRLASHAGRHWPVSAGYGVWSVCVTLVGVGMWSSPPALTMGLLVGCCVTGALVWRWSGGLAADSTDVMDE
ncbi:MAG TPA: lipopolysaccharide biosynthesis protein [Luteimonas sp.]|nr:lipopolysaccharide biosynthesis protein [Luteimonas sp.]